MNAEQIKAWREARGWSVRRLALELGVMHSTVSRWETGAVPVPPRWLDLALAALDCQHKPKPVD